MTFLISVFQVNYFDFEHVKFVNPFDLVSLQTIFSAFSFNEFEVSGFVRLAFFAVVKQKIRDSGDQDLRCEESGFFFKVTPNMCGNRTFSGLGGGLKFVDVPLVRRKLSFDKFFFVLEVVRKRCSKFSKISDFESVGFHSSSSSSKFFVDQSSFCSWICSSRSSILSMYSSASRKLSSTAALFECFPIRGSIFSSSFWSSLRLFSVSSSVNCLRFGGLSVMYQNTMLKFKYVSENKVSKNLNQLHDVEVGGFSVLGLPQSRCFSYGA